MPKFSWARYGRPTDPAGENEPLSGVMINGELVGSQPSGTSAARPPRRGLVLVIAGLVVVVLIGVGWWVLSRFSGGDDEHLPAIPFAPALSRPAFGQMVAAVKKRAGTTTVSQFQAFDGDYQVVVPRPKGGGPPQRYSFDAGTGLRSMGDDGVPRKQTFELTSLDTDALERLYDKAWHDSPGKVAHTSLTVEAPSYDGDSWVRIFITQTTESFYAVSGNLDGTVVDERQND